MRNFIILNGIHSDTINGLLISTLPPITKPLIRTTIEEIDGRDGDIVNTLGYSAYDKEFNIGLYGDYDINEIINYFNSKGKAIFSNEEDKFYNYQIIEQIDFEKLIRFKTAKVRMHIQPFKYSAKDNEKGFNVTNNSTNISIRNSGNIYSRPTITIYGTGIIELKLNNITMFQINMDSYSSITIDTNLMEAYNNTTLLNRLVTGDYDNFKLNVGNNVISWTGNITQIDISNYSRWL